jgi:predicted Kef-type K+ transport protein
MFGVGLHFSLRDLLSVKAIALPGAIVQIAIATSMGLAIAWWLGWPPAGRPRFWGLLSRALTISASLAQIGELSFILADVGRDLDSSRQRRVT